jgi:hypothetical protein
MRKSAQFIREYLLTTLFWGALVYLYLPWRSCWLPLLVVLPPLPVVAVSARMSPPSRRSAQVLMVLTALTATFYVFCARGTEGLAGELYNSDTLSFPARFQSVMHGERILGWNFGAASFFFPDMAFYFPLNALIPDFRLALVIFGVLQILAVLAGFALLEAEALPESRDKPLRLFVFAALLAYLARDSAYSGLKTLMGTGHHVGAFISLLFALWLILRMTGRETDRRSLLANSLALLFVTVLTTVSDALFLVQLVAPAVAALALMWLFALVSGRRLALLTATLMAGAMGGRLIYDRFFMRPDLRHYFSLSISRVSKPLGAVLTFLQEPGGIPILLGLFVLISIVACVGLILARIRRLGLRRGGSDGGLVCLSSFTVFLCLSNFSAIVLSSADSGSLARYTIPMVLFPLLLLSPLTQYALRAVAVDISRPVRLALLLVLPLLLVLTIQKSSNVVRLAGCYPKWVSDLDQEFAKRNLKFGLAQYWQAKYLSFFSRQGVQVVQVTSSLQPFLWENYPDSYQRPFEFIITDETAAKQRPDYKTAYYLDAERIVARFGPPDETFTCGTNTVRVYKDDRLHGCFPQFAELRKPGARVTFNAAQLPSQVGTVTGSSRVAEGCAAGYVTYGPYMQLLPGAYRGRIDYEATAASSEEAAGKWDVVLERPAGKNYRVVQKGLLSPQSACIEFGFEADSASVAEVRTFYDGTGRLTVHQLTLQRLR